jgi:hypothetical protein
LFNIAKDPTESQNLAESMPVKLQSMVQLYKDYAKTAKPALDWRWGFTDPNYKHNPSVSNTMSSSNSMGRRLYEARDSNQTCVGPFLESEYCAYGHEWECYVMRNTLEGCDVVGGHEIIIAEEEKEKEGSTVKCQNLCLIHDECEFWVLFNDTKECQLKSCRGKIIPCEDCVFGPKKCPI